MTGRQLLWAYDMNLNHYQVEFAKALASGLRVLRKGLCVYCSEWLGLWITLLMWQYPAMIFNLPIKAPAPRKRLTIVNDNK